MTAPAAQIERLFALVTELSDAIKHSRLSRVYEQTWEQRGSPVPPGDDGGPYPWQVDFHNAGANHTERAIIAGNRVGKTRSCGAEIACHITGWYPEWWEGHRFDRPTDWIISGPTNELTRNVCQNELLGPIGADRRPDGTGWVPQKAIGECVFRPGTPQVIDHIRVRSSFGGWSTVYFKSHEMGAEKFQAVAVDGFWLDEEPTDQGQIFAECQTRILTRDGLGLVSRTPLFGLTPMIQHFIEGKGDSWYVNATWDMAPHLDEKAKQRQLERYPEHERATRASGKPLMGSGGVFMIEDDAIMCDPFPIPDHWSRVNGIDFGIGHPFGLVCWAHDRDADCVYMYHAWKAAGLTPAMHVQAINSQGRWIPTAWPHDGIQRDKGTGQELRSAYLEAGANLLEESARWDDEKGGGQSIELGVMAMLERFRTGRAKVFRNLDSFLTEKRMYHRKDGVIVPKNDDLIKAGIYGLMGLRFAVTRGEAEWRPAPIGTRQEYESYDPLARR